MSLWEAQEQAMVKVQNFVFLKLAIWMLTLTLPHFYSPHPYSSLLVLKSQIGQNKISTSSAADQSVPGEISRFCPGQVPFSDGRTLCSANLPEQHNSSAPCICTPSSCFPGEHHIKVSLTFSVYRTALGENHRDVTTG